MSASTANSTDRPFIACFSEAQVLRCRVAQEGSGVMSDPKALWEVKHTGRTYSRACPALSSAPKGQPGNTENREESRKQGATPGAVETGENILCP